MPFRDPTRVLILPPGAQPPIPGQSVIVLDPSFPVPQIKLYTGDPQETAPAIIQGIESGGGNPQLEIIGPDASSTNGPAKLSMHISSGGPQESFIELDAAETLFQDGSAVTMLDLRGTDSIFNPALPQVVMPRFSASAADMQAQWAVDLSDTNGRTSITYEFPKGIGLTFVAPPSGTGLIIIRNRIQINTTAAVHRTLYASPRLGTGTTIGAGTNTAFEGVTGPNDDLGWLCDNAIANGTVEFAGSAVFFATGLTAGNAYNIILGTRLNANASTTYDILGQTVGWLPLY